MFAVLLRLAQLHPHFAWLHRGLHHGLAAVYRHLHFGQGCYSTATSARETALVAVTRPAESAAWAFPSGERFGDRPPAMQALRWASETLSLPADRIILRPDVVFLGPQLLHIFVADYRSPDRLEIECLAQRDRLGWVPQAWDRWMSNVPPGVCTWMPAGEAIYNALPEHPSFRDIVCMSI